MFNSGGKWNIYSESKSCHIGMSTPVFLHYNQVQNTQHANQELMIHKQLLSYEMQSIHRHIFGFHKLFWTVFLSVDILCKNILRMLGLHGSPT